MHLPFESLQPLLDTWGYLAVFLIVMVESSGIPSPGETILLTAAVYAGSERISIGWVIGAAAAGAIIGDNLGYWAGREGGYRLVRRFGGVLRLDERKLTRIEHFYRRHGDKTVFFGRFVALLRAWSAFLAGANRMPWRPFLFFNAAGGIVWATVYGMLGFYLARNLPLLQQIVRDVGVGSVMLAAAAILLGVLAWRRKWWRYRA